MLENFDANILAELNEESNIRIRDPSLLNNSVNVLRTTQDNLTIQIGDNLLNQTINNFYPVDQSKGNINSNSSENIININVSPITTQINSTLSNELAQKINNILQLNNGKTASHIFATELEMNNRLLEKDFTSQLSRGDIFFILKEEEPDYWWDGFQAQKIETDKLKLNEIIGMVETGYTFVVSDSIPTLDDKKIITFVI